MDKSTTLCPFCKSEFDVEENWIGQVTSCPVCGKDFTIRAKEIPVQTPPPPAAVPQTVPVRPVQKAVPVQPVQKAVPVQPVQKAVPVRPVQKAVPVQPVRKAVPVQPVQKAVPVRPVQKEPKARKKISFPRPPKKVVVAVCVCVGLALSGTGGYFLKCKITEARRRAVQEEERRLKEAAKRAAEEKRQQEEAARKAAEEKRRQEEAARKAERENRLRTMGEKVLSEWESARRQRHQEKMFLLAPGQEGSRLLLFRYDARLAVLIEEALLVRKRLIEYNRGVSAAVSAYEKNDLAAVDKLYQGGLKGLEPNADALSKQMAELSGKIAALAVEKNLSAGQFAVPANGSVQGEVRPGRYILVLLSAQNDDDSYTFLKEARQPTLLGVNGGRWHDLSGDRGLEKFCTEPDIPVGIMERENLMQKLVEMAIISGKKTPRNESDLNQIKLRALRTNNPELFLPAALMALANNRNEQMRETVDKGVDLGSGGCIFVQYCARGLTSDKIIKKAIELKFWPALLRARTNLVIASNLNGKKLLPHESEIISSCDRFLKNGTKRLTIKGDMSTAPGSFLIFGEKICYFSASDEKPRNVTVNGKKWDDPAQPFTLDEKIYPFMDMRQIPLWDRNNVEVVNWNESIAIYPVMNKGFEVSFDVVKKK